MEEFINTMKETPPKPETENLTVDKSNVDHTDFEDLHSKLSLEEQKNEMIFIFFF